MQHSIASRQVMGQRQVRFPEPLPAGVGVLVALPGHIVHVGHIRTEKLPVKASVLQEHLQ